MTRIEPYCCTVFCVSNNGWWGVGGWECWYIQRHLKKTNLEWLCSKKKKKKRKTGYGICECMWAYVRHIHKEQKKPCLAWSCGSHLGPHCLSAACISQVCSQPRSLFSTTLRTPNTFTPPTIFRESFPLAHFLFVCFSSRRLPHAPSAASPLRTDCPLMEQQLLSC